MPKDFGVFETIRKVKYGGTMRAIHKDLSPKLIKEYPEPFELVVVEVNVHSKNNKKNYWCWPSGKLRRGKTDTILYSPQC